MSTENKPADDLQQQLLELVYGLLPDDEAAALQERMANDPEVAVAHAEAQRFADMLAASARLAAPHIELVLPAMDGAKNRAATNGEIVDIGAGGDSMAIIPGPSRATGDVSGEAAPPKTSRSEEERRAKRRKRRRGERSLPAVARPSPRRSSDVEVHIRRAMRRTAAIAAAVLAAVTLGGYAISSWPLVGLNAKHVHLVVAGPRHLEPGVDNLFTINTTSATERPLTAAVRYKVHTADGQTLVPETEESTDRNGRLTVRLRADLGDAKWGQQAALEITPVGQSGITPLTASLRIEPTPLATQLALDKPIYQPGDIVRYRSLTLTRFSLNSPNETAVDFEVHDPSGALIPGTSLSIATQHGVGSGEFQIPANFPGGEYTLFARSLVHRFADAKRTFFVRQYRLPRLKKDLEFTRDSYAPGDHVAADLSVQRTEGSPAAGARLHCIATVDGQIVSQTDQQADSAGAARVEITLPTDIKRGDAQLAVIVDDGGNRETIAKTIRINLDRVEVSLYPEGGELIAGMENRVYFMARNPLGKPAHIDGQLVDQDGREIARVQTTYKGMGSFKFTPRASGVYTLKLDGPAHVDQEPKSLEPNPAQHLVLSTGHGVFEPKQPLTLTLESNEHDRPLVVAAYCRGALVGQQAITAHEGMNSVEIPLASDVGGVVRVTVFERADANSSETRAVAERLVYRRPEQVLKINVADHQPRFSPRDPVELSLAVTNERGEPTAAALGVSVSPDTLLKMIDDELPSMPTQFYLTSEIEKPEDLEKADFFLSDDPQAPAALDLLLGTQGWRRFVDSNPAEFVQADNGKEHQARVAAAGEAGGPPLVLDNGQQVAQAYQADLDRLQTKRADELQSLGRYLLLGGSPIALLLLFIATWGSVGGLRFWLPTIGTATACFAVAWIWSEGAMKSATIADGSSVANQGSPNSTDSLFSQTTSHDRGRSGADSTAMFDSYSSWAASQAFVQRRIAQFGEPWMYNASAQHGARRMGSSPLSFGSNQFAFIPTDPWHYGSDVSVASAMDKEPFANSSPVILEGNAWGVRPPTAIAPAGVVFGSTSVDSSYTTATGATLSLSNSNIYSGAVTINGGTLRAANTVTATAGGMIDFGASATNGSAGAFAVTTSSLGTGGVGANNSAIYSGGTTLGGVVYDSNLPPMIDRGGTGATGFTKIGTGTVTVTGGGLTVVNGGTLKVDNGVLTLNGADATVLANDRRYTHIAVNSTFSSVGDVETFDFAKGAPQEPGGPADGRGGGIFTDDLQQIKIQGAGGIVLIDGNHIPSQVIGADPNGTLPISGLAGNVSGGTAAVSLAPGATLSIDGNFAKSTPANPAAPIEFRQGSFGTAVAQTDFKHPVSTHIYSTVQIREYAHHHDSSPSGARTDFTETLYWNPLLITDGNGKATIKFELADAVAKYRVLVDAHAYLATDEEGRIGSGTGEVVSTLPVSFEPKLPLEVNAGDRIDLPVAVVNDTDHELPVSLALNLPSSVSSSAIISQTVPSLVEVDGASNQQLQIPAGGRKRTYFPLKVVGDSGPVQVEVRGEAGKLSDAKRQTISVVPAGYPVAAAYAGNLSGEVALTVRIPDEKELVPNSLQVALAAYPSAIGEIEDGVESILCEPNGCFEQTSASNYPNVLALEYLQSHKLANPELTRRAKALIASGYVKLTSYECREKGYEWFGGDPGHEALTAYGLMEFREMARVYEVDPAMLKRTADWLMSRRNGQGGFQRNSKSCDSFGSAPEEMTNAYIVWALTESGQTGIEAEIKHAIEIGRSSDDPYIIALAAASAINGGDAAAGRELLEKLAKLQAEDGHLEGHEGSITRSGGISLRVETTALAALAWLKSPAFGQQAHKAIDWIIKNRQGSGGFGSTQGTILALKALVENARLNSKTVTGGELVVKRNGQSIGRAAFTADQQGTIRIAGLAAKLRPGENRLTVSLTGENQLPFSLDVGYRAYTGASDPACPVRLSTKLAAGEVKAGETVGLEAELSNATDKGQPMTIAILGLPAGLQPRANQLEELKKAGKIDYYETRAREVIFYWRSLAPRQKIPLRLDLVAEFPGQYTAPASRAYLYYTAEQKQWVEPLRVTITRE